MYQVRLEVFEGPFDLLLNLIMKQKLDIYDIPISKISEEYLTYLRQMKDLNLEVASEFILIALTLLEIKISSLLPSDEPEREEISPSETRELLIARLIEYKKFKDASTTLAGLSQASGRIYSREVELEEKFAHLRPDFLQDLKLEDMAEIYKDFIIRQNMVVDFSHISPITVTLEEQIEKIMSTLQVHRRVNFRELTIDYSSKIEIIVTFLAILELFRNGAIHIDQAETFGELEMQLL